MLLNQSMEVLYATLLYLLAENFNCHSLIQNRRFHANTQFFWQEYEINQYQQST